MFRAQGRREGGFRKPPLGAYIKQASYLNKQHRVIKKSLNATALLIALYLEYCHS